MCARATIVLVAGGRNQDILRSSVMNPFFTIFINNYYNCFETKANNDNLFYNCIYFYARYKNKQRHNGKNVRIKK